MHVWCIDRELQLQQHHAECHASTRPAAAHGRAADERPLDRARDRCGGRRSSSWRPAAPSPRHRARAGRALVSRVRPSSLAPPRAKLVGGAAAETDKWKKISYAFIPFVTLYMGFVFVRHNSHEHHDSEQVRPRNRRTVSRARASGRARSARARACEPRAPFSPSLVVVVRPALSPIRRPPSLISSLPPAAADQVRHVHQEARQADAVGAQGRLGLRPLRHGVRRQVQGGEGGRRRRVKRPRGLVCRCGRPGLPRRGLQGARSTLRARTWEVWGLRAYWRRRAPERRARAAHRLCVTACREGPRGPKCKKKPPRIIPSEDTHTVQSSC